MTAQPQPATPLTREDCLALDAGDPLAGRRQLFHVPEGVIYLDGNSLGCLPLAAVEHVRRTLETEWGEGLIRSWTQAGWIDKPRRLGDRIGGLIGAAPGQVVVADSTSVNLFKVLTAALRLRPGRDVIVSEAGNFPTDLYIAEGVAELLGGYERRLVPEGSMDVEALIDERVAVVMLTHVNYVTAEMHDMAAVTRAAHQAGALVIWDLAHSAGALPVDLDGIDADFAVGCTYKYLNAGPGGPAYLYVASRLQDRARQPLTGWLGHARPFEFTTGYEPAPGIDRFICGTPPLLAYAALEGALDAFDGVDLGQLRAKSLSLTDLFIRLVAQECGGHGLTLASPRERAVRGSHVSWRHREGYAIMQALIARGVIGDFRAPDALRFGFTPLYLSHADVWGAVAVLKDVLDNRLWDDPAYRSRAKVT
ncbi:MAG: kynureninase [Azospirillaceae bacterium]